MLASFVWSVLASVVWSVLASIFLAYYSIILCFEMFFWGSSAVKLSSQGGR
jgi:hypothetical protein